MPRESTWDQCQAHARHVSDDGKETVVICDQGAHADPQDGTAKHYDERLDIYWSYADEGGYDDEEDPVDMALRDL